VGNAKSATVRLLRHGFLEPANLSRNANTRNTGRRGDDGQASRIVASIFEPLEALNQDWGNVSLRNSTDDSTHKSYFPGLDANL